MLLVEIWIGGLMIEWKVVVVGIDVVIIVNNNKKKKKKMMRLTATMAHPTLAGDSVTVATPLQDQDVVLLPMPVVDTLPPIILLMKEYLAFWEEVVEEEEQWG